MIEDVACSERSKIVVFDENNYAFSNTMTIQRSVLKSATDLFFDWSEVTQDFFGKTVDPAADIDLFLISLWQLTADQLEAKLSIDDLSLSSVIAPVSTYGDEQKTSQNLLGFDVLGEPLPEDELWRYFDTNHPKFDTPQDSHVFLVTAQTGTEVGKNARMLHMFTLDPNSQQTELRLTNDSTKLQYEAELELMEPYEIPPLQANLMIDWSNMTQTSLGKQFRPDQINEVVVAHFPNATLPELEMDFLNLQDRAAAWYTGFVSAGYSLGLSGLSTQDGRVFSGIDGDGIWLAALFCRSNCNSPAPWSLTVLKPCSP